MIEHVLATITDGRHIEVFGSKNVRVRVINIPVAPALEGEILAEQLIRKSLATPYANLWFPGNCRAEEIARIITVAELLERDHDMSLVDVLNSIKNGVN